MSVEQISINSRKKVSEKRLNFRLHFLAPLDKHLHTHTYTLLVRLHTHLFISHSHLFTPSIFSAISTHIYHALLLWSPTLSLSIIYSFLFIILGPVCPRFPLLISIVCLISLPSLFRFSLIIFSTNIASIQWTLLSQLSVFVTIIVVIVCSCIYSDSILFEFSFGFFQAEQTTNESKINNRSENNDDICLKFSLWKENKRKPLFGS